MDADDLKKRTKVFGLDIIKLVETLPHTPAGKVIGNQLLHCGLSVGANYRATGRARSPAEFNVRLGACIRETDESQYWLELLAEAELVPAEKIQPLMQEADELVAILTASVKTAKENLYRRTPARPVKPIR
jgi:four helix bundle protein